VSDIKLADEIIYVAGGFTGIGGQPRKHVAAVDMATGQATPWNPDPNSDVFTLLPAGATVYVGGVFTRIGGQARSRLASLDPVTGLATAWNPRVAPVAGIGDNADSAVYSLALSGSTLFVGGDFTGIGGRPRTSLAALDGTTGQAGRWNPIPNDGRNDVYALATSDGKVYLGGFFTFLGGDGGFATFTP
jgi:trimeric autotransporter adhesin